MTSIFFKRDLAYCFGCVNGYPARYSNNQRYIPYDILYVVPYTDLMQLTKVCRAGDVRGIQLLIDRNIPYKHRTTIDMMRWDTLIYDACWSGNRELVELLIALGAHDWDEGLSGACHGGHQEIVDLMIQRGAQDFNWGLYGACRGGHVGLVEQMISLGADDIKEGLEEARQCGHPEVVEYLERAKE